MKRELINQLSHKFEDRVHNEEGVEFWLPRDIQQLFGYDDWFDWFKVVEQAKIACGNAGIETSHHFISLPRKNQSNDVRLTRFACCLIAQNGEPEKSSIKLQQKK